MQMPPQTNEGQFHGMIAGHAAWLAQDQNVSIKKALRKIIFLQESFDFEPIASQKLNELEKILEDMERINFATLTAFRASQ